MKVKTVLFRTTEILIGGVVLAAAIVFYVKTGTERSINTGRRKAEIPAVKIVPVKTSPSTRFTVSKFARLAGPKTLKTRFGRELSPCERIRRRPRSS